MAKLSGIPDYPFVIAEYPHIPTAVWSDEEIDVLAAALAPAVQSLLTRGI
jgi:hypothetical protein